MDTKRDPNFNPRINPQFNPRINPKYTFALNPKANSGINPKFASDLNPTYNSDINPQYNSTINPSYTSDINPRYNTQLNPKNNYKINPHYVLSIPGKYLWTLRLGSIGYTVKQSDRFFLLFNNKDDFTGFAVAADKKEKVFVEFSADNIWVGYFIVADAGILLRFDREGNWVGHGT